MVNECKYDNSDEVKNGLETCTIDGINFGGGVPATFVCDGLSLRGLLRGVDMFNVRNEVEVGLLYFSLVNLMVNGERKQDIHPYTTQKRHPYTYINQLIFILHIDK